MFIKSLSAARKAIRNTIDVAESITDVVSKKMDQYDEQQRFEKRRAHHSTNGLSQQDKKDINYAREMAEEHTNAYFLLYSRKEKHLYWSYFTSYLGDCSLEDYKKCITSTGAKADLTEFDEFMDYLQLPDNLISLELAPDLYDAEEERLWKMFKNNT